MSQRYCTNCGAQLGTGDRFCAGCGKPAHEAAALATPEADVDVPPPRQTADGPPGSDKPRIKRVVKVSRLDKIVGLILAVVVGVPLLLVILWVVFPFLLGFVYGVTGG